MSGRSGVEIGTIGNGLRTARKLKAQSNLNMILIKVVMLAACLTLGLGYFIGQSDAKRGDEYSQTQTQHGFDRQISENARLMIEQGRRIFRYDTFGDEAYWSDKLKLHQAIQGSKFGGVGPGVSPKGALAVGLKVDMDALPQPLVNQLKQGKVNLDDPATTLALIKLDAVLGVKGTFN